jgi:hypothetical protein
MVTNNHIDVNNIFVMEKSKDTKITRLRNLMTPTANYVAMVKNFDNIPDDKKDGFKQILSSELEKVCDSMPEILEIIKEIPDDAIESFG